MARMRSVRVKNAALAILLMLVAGSCKRETRDGTEVLTGSLLFDNASPEVREALASRVDFRINDENFAQWERAQRNLERLPRSAIPAIPATGRTAIDRAVVRLESSPYARTAIERTGLSVREFVLETIALAQATEAARTGKSVSGGPIPPENFRFVQRYSARALYSQSRVARGGERDYDRDSDEGNGDNNQGDMEIQMRLDEMEHQAEIRRTELEMQREELERAAEAQLTELENRREELERAAEMQREDSERAADRERARRERDSARREQKEEQHRTLERIDSTWKE
jgi:hypothetical protein